MAEYASNAKANAALTTGIIGTALGGVAAAGGLGGLLGITPRPPMDPMDRPVTRYEIGLMNENRDLRDQITLLTANSHTDNVAVGLQRQIDGQMAVNAAVNSTLDSQQRQIAEIRGITRIYVPNDNVAPGWGAANVQPAPPALPYPYPYPWPWPPAPPQGQVTPPSTSSTASG